MKSLAERIGLSPSTIYGWIADPEIAFPPPTKLGKRLSIFSTTAVNAWLAARAGTLVAA